jgi:2-polyprenyl-3-methyl-5-hydroxy-6-metoxy-1,4-benzoquinol methylase
MTGQGTPSCTPTSESANRRLGDRVEIVGDYQLRARESGFVVQRFWHHLKTVTIERFAPPDLSMVVLDVGCGSGVVAAYLAARARSVHAVDCNPQAIGFARQAFARDNLVFHLGLADEVDLPPGSVDRVYCLELVEHLYSEQAARLLSGLGRLLTPTGTLFLTTPNYHSAWPLIEKLLDLFHLVPPLAEEQHVWRPTRARLRRLADAAGLRERAMGRTCGLAPFASVLGWRLARAVDRCETKLGSPFGNLLYALWERA